MKTKSKPKAWAFRDKWATVDWSLTDAAIAAQLGCHVVSANKARHKHEAHIREIISGLDGCAINPDGTVTIDRNLQPALHDAVLDEELGEILKQKLEAGEITIVGEKNGETLYEVVNP